MNAVPDNFDPENGIDKKLIPVVTAARKLRSWSERYRTSLLLLALLGFLVGLIFAIRQPGFTLDQIRWLPLLTLVVVVVPMTLAYSAINLQVMAKASNAQMSFATATQASVFASLAELLPLPGGAIVRSAALARAGATAFHSVELVLAFALLWIAISAAGAGFALLEVSTMAAPVALGGGAATIAITAWIGRRYGGRTAIAAFSLRLIGLGITVLRVGLALMALSIAFEWTDTLAFAFAIVAGTASAIVPAGLGLSEGLAAVLASAVEVSPAGAFLAVALGRLAGFVVNCLCAAGYILIALVQRRKAASADV